MVEPECEALVGPAGDVDIRVGRPAFLHHLGSSLLLLLGASCGEVGRVCEDTTASGSVDTIQLSIFSHRFMSIAEQMGRVLQRSAISTNIKVGPLSGPGLL